MRASVSDKCRCPVDFYCAGGFASTADGRSTCTASSETALRAILRLPGPRGFFVHSTRTGNSDPALSKPALRTRRLPSLASRPHSTSRMSLANTTARVSVPEYVERLSRCRRSSRRPSRWSGLRPRPWPVAPERNPRNLVRDAASSLGHLAGRRDGPVGARRVGLSDKSTHVFARRRRPAMPGRGLLAPRRRRATRLRPLLSLGDEPSRADRLEGHGLRGTVDLIDAEGILRGSRELGALPHQCQELVVGMALADQHRHQSHSVDRVDPPPPKAPGPTALRSTRPPSRLPRQDRWSPPRAPTTAPGPASQRRRDRRRAPPRPNDSGSSTRSAVGFRLTPELQAGVVGSRTLAFLGAGPSVGAFLRVSAWSAGVEGRYQFVNGASYPAGRVSSTLSVPPS